MVRQWQDLFYEKRYSATVLDDGVDYVKLAEAMGATGYRATNREEFNKALKKALASDTPVSYTHLDLENAVNRCADRDRMSERTEG